MCSCDTSSGRTVSAQRQAAFSSWSRGAIALTEIALAEPGGLRRRLRLRPNGHGHLPAERTQRSLQPGEQSITGARHSRRARPPAPQLARPAAKRHRRRYPTAPASADVGGGPPCRSLRMRAPRSPCAESPSNPTGGRKQSVCPKETRHVFFSTMVKAAIATLQPPSSTRTSGSFPLLSTPPL